MCAFRFLKRLPALALVALLWLAPSAFSQIIPGPAPVFVTTNLVYFEAASFTVNEDGLQALITVLRTNAFGGGLTNADIVRVEYDMIDGTALSGVHYFRVNGNVFFLPGEDRAQFTVPIIDNFSADGNVSLTLVLRNPQGGTETFLALGNPNTATLTIRDDESTTVGAPESGFVEIAPGNYRLAPDAYVGTKEEWNTSLDPAELNATPYGPGGIEFTIVRKGGSRGRILVDWQTTTNVTPVAGGFFFIDAFGNIRRGGGLAVPGLDFLTTNGTVVLDDYQMSATVLLRLPATVVPEAFERFSTNFPSPPSTFGVELTGTRPAPEEAGHNLNPALGQDIRRRVCIADISNGFSPTRAHYVVNEGQRFVRVRIRRSNTFDETNPVGPVHVHYTINPRLIAGDARGGDHQGNLFPLEPGSDYSTPFIDYEPPGSPMWTETVRTNNFGPGGSGWVQVEEEATINWGDREVTDRYILIPLIDDNEAEFNEDMEVVLWKHDGETDGFVNPYMRSFRIKIIDNDQPAGASEVTFNRDADPLTDPPYMLTPGANNTVQAVATQPDGKVILGGDFSAVNTAPRNRIARLNFDGSTDRSFTPGTGVSGFVRALAVQPDGRIIVAGGFDAYNGIPRFNLARILTNGVLDATFNPGLGSDGPIRAVAIQPDGKILIGGEFNSYNGTNMNYVARLNPNGALDTSFTIGAGPDGPVNSIAVSSGSIEIEQSAYGGPAENRYLVDTGSSRGVLSITYDFYTIPDSIRVYYGSAKEGGVAIYDSGLVSSNGVIQVTYPPPGVPASTTFLEVVMNEGSGILGTVWNYTLRIDPEVDPRPVIGGEFTSYNGIPINYIARLNVDGTLDRSFDPGSGADDRVYAVAKLGNKVVMAGDFRTVNLQERRGIARLNENGSVDQLFDPGSGFDNSVFALTIQPSGKPVVGGVFRSFNETRRIGMARLNLDGSLDTSFMDTAKNHFAGVPNPLNPENTESQENFIRSLAPYRFTNVAFITNFVVDPTNNTVTNEIVIPTFTITDHLFAGGRFTRMGGGFRRDQMRPRLNIARVVGGSTPGPGNISFERSNYSVDENAGSTFITVVRTNGSLAPISARFEALDFTAGTGVATGGLDYQPATFTPLWIRSHDRDRQYSDAFMGPNFNAFTTNRPRTDLNIYAFPNRPELRYDNFGEDNIFLTVFDDNLVEGDEVVRLRLTAPDEGRLLLGGEPIPVGTALGFPNATLTIADNDFSFGTLGFAETQYFVNEDETDAVITLTRVGGSSGTVTVDVYTRDGTATSVGNPPDYNAVTRRTITFANGQTTNRFTVRINNDTIAELEETVFLFMTNATGFPANVPAAQRLDPARSTATLFIIDDDFAAGRISFTAPSVSVIEGDGEVTVTVRRSGGNAGDLAVSYRTENGSARAGIDYTAVSGLLRWTDRESSAKTFTVPILDNDLVEGEKTFTVILSNPTIPGALGAQPAATIRIQNDDAAGIFSFSQPLYSVDENAPYADITVLRQDGISGAVTVRFAAADATAVGSTNASITSTATGLPDYIFPEYVAANGFTNILRFAEGQTAASFRIPLVDDGLFEGEKRLTVSLLSPTGGAQLGQAFAEIVIVDDEQNRIPAGLLDTEFLGKGADDYIYSLALQPDGRIVAGGDFRFMNDVSRNRLARLLPNGVLDPSFVTAAAPNESVRGIDLQESDGRILIGGLFRTVGATNRNHLARLNADGQADPTFDPGSGTDNPIYAVLEQPDGKVIIAGNFSTYRLVARKSIARLNSDGLLDTTFNPGTGANGAIWAVALQRDGKILIGGDFTAFNEIPRNRIARLNRDGSVDRTFGEGLDGAGGSVRNIFVQSDGNALIGGLFTSVNGRPYNRIARLRTTGAGAGSLDESFTLGLATDQERALSGANGAVNVIAVQLDGKILVGGDFTRFNGRTRNRITRLNADGSLDPTINFGAGANGPVSAIVVQPDRRILLGGGFTEYDGSPARYIARIHGGAISGAGQLQFTSPFFSAEETEADAVVNIRRTGGTTGTLKVDFRTLTNDTAIVGQDFRSVTNTIEFPEAETFVGVRIPLLRNTNVLEDRHIEVVLTNLVGNGSLGPQPRARVRIINVDAQIEFSRPDYSVTEDFGPGAATITVRRIGSTVAPLSVDFRTFDDPDMPDAATAVLDYGPVSTTLSFAPGESSRTVAVPIFDDSLVEGNERVTLILTNLVGLGAIRTPRATLTIVDNDFSPGQIEFAAPTFFGIEGSRQMVIRLRRVGGTTGVISVEYETRAGGENPAQTPSDYETTRGIVSFSDGVVQQSFIIPIFDDQLVEGNETFIVRLFNPRGGASIIGPTEAVAVIVDDDLPAGSLDRTFDPGTGANGEVRTVKLDRNARVLIGGSFNVFNGVNRSHIARLSPDAALDATFDPGAGPDGTVAAIALDPDGRFTIGGQFNTVRGLFLNRVARLLADASPDPSFSLPLGLNAEVSEVVRQPDGKVIIGGTFDIVDAAILNHIARLNADGTVDLGFNPGGGTDGNVYAVALQPDGKILVGGTFSRVDGINKSGIVRLNPNGSPDLSFNAAGGGAFGGGVQDILLLADGRIMIAGDFTSYNTSARSRVARLNADGSLDPSFNPGAGPNRVVYAIGRQPDGKFVIAGDFTSVAGLNRTRIARLDENGAHDLEFRPGGGANEAVLALAIQPDDGRILIAGRFTQVDNEPRAGIARLNNDKGFITARDVVFSPVVRQGDRLQFTASTQVGFSYTLESSESLAGSWVSEQTVVAQGTATTFEIVPSRSHQFFRIRRE